MIIEHLGKRPRIAPSAWIAPTATVCGDVNVGENARVLFGASVIAEGGRIEIGSNGIVMENAVVRSSERHSTSIGDNTLIGPCAHVVGCTIGECSFIATGAAVFHAAVLGARCEVRIHGVVHLRTHLAPDTTVPIGWVAVGNPARILPPHEHDEIWSQQQPLNFPQTVYGIDRPPAGSSKMPEVARRLSEIYGGHRSDLVIS